MPKKTTTITMTGYPPFSTRRWQLLGVAEVGSAGRGTVRLVLAPVDDPRQAGRLVHHDLPAVLARNSPLSECLAQGFGLTVTTGQTVDLAVLVGRRLLAKFGEPGPDGEQAIVAVKPGTKSTAKPVMPPVVPVPPSVANTAPGKSGGAK